MNSLLSSNRLTFIKFNVRLNQIMLARNTIMQSVVNIICISELSEIGKDIQPRIEIVKLSKRRPNRSKYGPAPSRFLNLFKSDGVLRFFIDIVSLFSLDLL